MKLAPRMVAVVALAPYVVRCTFADGEVRDVNMEPILEGPVFGPLRDPARFAQAFLDEDSHTLAWPGEIDLDREVIYGLYPAASSPCPQISTPQRV